MTVLSTTVAVKEAVVCPALSITDAGTVSLDVLFEESCTVISRVGAADDVTVPLIVPSPSVAVAGKIDRKDGGFVVMNIDVGSRGQICGGRRGDRDCFRAIEQRIVDDGDGK